MTSSSPPIEPKAIVDLSLQEARMESLSRALGLGHEPSAIMEELRSLYDEVDQELSAAGFSAVAPCRPGCDACCHESVFLSATEFLLVSCELLRTRSDADLRAIVEQMGVIALRFEDELELLETIPAGSERDEVAARVKFRCPLLTSDGLCSVHPVRELNARTFGQSFDGVRGEPYGCALTHESLRIVPDRPKLFDAREARNRLLSRFPGMGRVHVYPWWFLRFGSLILPDGL